MKGEQEIVEMPKKPDMIYFGLMPHKLDPEVDIVHSGFQGCMNYLQVSFPEKFWVRVKHLEKKWAPSLLLDYLKICHFDFRG